jgi:hypothetical protein
LRSNVCRKKRWYESEVVSFSVHCLMTWYVYNSSHNCVGNNIVVVLLVLVNICHIMTQRCFMLCTTYINFWSIIPHNYGNCYTHIMSLNNVLKKKQLHFHTIAFYGKHCFSNIKTSSKRLEYLNIFPSFFKKFNTSWNQYLCFIYFNNLVKYLSVARLRRCLISSKTVEISWAKFQERTGNYKYHIWPHI